MRFSPEILACHAEFGGDLEDMQRRYDADRAPPATPTAAMDEEALRLARKATAAINDPARKFGLSVVSEIQIAILEGMRWASGAALTPAEDDKAGQSEVGG